MQALMYTTDYEPKPGVLIPEADLQDKRAHADSDKIFRNPKIELVEIPKPKIKRPDEVLIKIKACGVCGTDCHLLETNDEGYQLYPGHMKGNQVMGHEFAGVIEEIGSGVNSLKVGDKVTIEEMMWCGKCDNCRNGQPNQCTNLDEYGITVDGGYAEYVVGREQYCWNINEFANVYTDERKMWQAGALCEPASVAYNAVYECGGGFRPGSYVVIFGGGPIGLFATAHCKTGGAAKVIVFELIKERIELAKQMGADIVINPNELKGQDTADAIMDLTGGKGADFFVEASGVGQRLYPFIERSLACNARVVMTAFGTERIPVYMVPFHFKKGKILMAVGHSGHGTFMNVTRLIANGRFDPTKVVTGTFKLSQAMAAIEAAKGRAGGKVIFEMD